MSTARESEHERKMSTQREDQQGVKCWEDSQALKVSTRELKEQVLSPDESSVSVVRIARQARSEQGKKLFKISDKEQTRSSSPAWRGAGKALLGIERRSGAFKRETRKCWPS